MSGSGNSNWSGGGASTDSGVSCEELVIETQLSSPVAAVIAGVNIGDVLPVEIRTVSGTVVVIVTHKGAVAGGLASPQLQRLRECMNGGTVYKATVLSKSNGQVRVRVRAGQP